MFVLLLSGVFCDRFAILVAGSKDWNNYRHQADVFAIYEKLLNRGYKKSNIILMAYNDVVDSIANPYEGRVYHELGHNHDVYPGKESINVIGDDVVKEKFFEILTKELKSTEADDLYIYFDDHGSSGLICFPYDVYCYADELADALAEMEKNGKYGRCLFGIEACYAGSVAQMIRNDNMVILTAANEKESSYADVWDMEVDMEMSKKRLCLSKLTSLFGLCLHFT